MATDDPIRGVREMLADLARYEAAYVDGDFRYESTIGRLANAVTLLADEVESLRSQLDSPDAPEDE